MKRSKTVLKIAALAFIAIFSWPAVQNARFARTIANAQNELSLGEIEPALISLESAKYLKPSSAKVHLLLASARRRNGEFREAEQNLKAAEKLVGASADSIELQRLLIASQQGNLSNVEEKLKQLILKSQDDADANDIYEALCQGYIASFRFSDAMQLIQFWTEWKPQEVTPRLLRVDLLKRTLDFPGAIEECRAVVKLAPKQSAAWEQLGNLLLSNLEIDEAEVAFKTCERLGRRTDKITVGLADIAFRRGDAEKAEALLKEADLSTMPPENAALVWKLKADIARFQRRDEDAIKILTQAIEQWPHEASLHQAIATAYSAYGERAKATHHLEVSKQILDRSQRFFELQKRLLESPNSPDIRCDLAEILWEQGLKDDAANWWRSGLKNDAKHWRSHQGLARYCEEKGLAEEAGFHRQISAGESRQAFRFGVEAVRNNGLAEAKNILPNLDKNQTLSEHRILGAGILVKEKQFSQAVTELSGLEKLSAELQHHCDVFLGEALVGLEQPTKALEHFHSALQSNDRDIYLHRWLAALYYDLGVSPLAELHLLQVADLDKGDYRPHRLLGVINKDAEIFDEAVKCFTESLRREPAQPPREQVLTDLAECLIRQRQFKEALAAIEQVSPSTSKSIIRAECLVNLGKPNDAAPLLKQILKEEPNHLAALVLSADIAMVGQKSETAVALLETACKQHPNDYSAHTKLAQLYARLDQKEKATPILKHAEAIKELRTRFSKLHGELESRPFDPAIRLELADVAEKLGFTDLQEMWVKSAAMLKQE